MVRIYLGIETYRPKDGDSFLEERIIAIGFTEDRSPYSERIFDRYYKTQLLTEWEEKSEKQLILKFYEIMQNLDARYIVIMGHNILRFDLPLLIQKLSEFKKIEILNLFWHHRVYVMDFLQQLLPYNDFRFYKLSLANVVELAKKIEISYAPEPLEIGKKIREYYENNEYIKIEQHLSRNLTATRWLYQTLAIKKMIDYSTKKEKPLFQIMKDLGITS